MKDIPAIICSCLNCYLHFYVCGMLITFLDSGEMCPCVGAYILCISALYSPPTTVARSQVIPGLFLACVFGLDLPHDCSFLALVSSPLVLKAGLEACASFLVGGASAFHWWMGPAWAPARHVSWGMSIEVAVGSGSLKEACLLRWNCVPPSFLSWPETTQHWTIAVKWAKSSHKNAIGFFIILHDL